MKRAALIVWAWATLRRPAPLAGLQAEDRVGPFLWKAIVPAGRHLAVAIAFLPRKERRAATVAYLCCRALDAFEDLSPRPAADVEHAARYLLGERQEPPPTMAPTARRESDRVEQILATKLALLRAALESLPEAVGARGLVETMARAMSGGARAEQREYSRGVLGAAVDFAARLVAPGQSLPAELTLATGRALQLANHLRDVEHDLAIGAASGSPSERRVQLRLDLIDELPAVLLLLRGLKFPKLSGARGCATFLALTTAAFLAREAGASADDSLAHPLWQSVRAAWSPAAYQRCLAALEGRLDAGLWPLGGKIVPPCARARAFERHLALSHPDQSASIALAVSAHLISLTDELGPNLPAAALRGPMPAEVRSRVMVSDHLLFLALRRVAAIGDRELRELGDVVSRRALRAHADPEGRADALDLVAFLSRCRSRGEGIGASETEAMAAAHTSIAGELAALDARDESARRAARVRIHDVVGRQAPRALAQILERDLEAIGLHPAPRHT